jgi:hypothetical protein
MITKDDTTTLLFVCEQSEREAIAAADELAQSSDPAARAIGERLRENADARRRVRQGIHLKVEAFEKSAVNRERATLLREWVITAYDAKEVCRDLSPVVGVAIANQGSLLDVVEAFCLYAVRDDETLLAALAYFRKSRPRRAQEVDRLAVRLGLLYGLI